MINDLLRLEQIAGVHRALGDPHRLVVVEALGLSDRTPAELGEITGLPTNLLAFHLRVLSEAGVVERRRSAGDRRRRYVVLRPESLGVTRAVPAPQVLQPLFVCTRNSARSQLAAAIWRSTTGRPATSAGRDPAARVHPLAVAVAADAGLDLSAARPVGYDAVTGEPDLVVSVCDRAREAPIPFPCPQVHWAVADPVGGGRDAFAAAFTEIAQRVRHLAERVAA